LHYYLLNFKGYQDSFEPILHIGAIIVNFDHMRKAEFISFENKKESQLQEDAALGPAGRFRKMFMLISMSIFLSPTKQLKVFTDDRFIELKRKAT
jgi:hypothetical protein